MNGAILRLVKAWAVMGGLTAAAVFAGKAHGGARPDAMLMVVLMGLTFAKAAVLAHHYLDLRHAAGWNSAMRGSIAALLIVLLGLALVAG